MRANYKMQRLYLNHPMSALGNIELDKEQANYVGNVLRMKSGAEILVFNGADGEWLAKVNVQSKRSVGLELIEQVRPQPIVSDLMFCFAPLKVGRLDYMVQKAVEMGASSLQPVITDFTQNHRLQVDKMRKWSVEAAEQCGVLGIPESFEPTKLDVLLDGWDENRTLIFCDEDSETSNPVAALKALKRKSLGLLIGPEGGFSDAERSALRAKPFVTSLTLGPRILRADTAAVAALAVVQATIGDW